MASKHRARQSRTDDSKEVGRNSANEGPDDDDEESGKSGVAAIPAEAKEDAGVQGSGESSPARDVVALKTRMKRSKRAKKPPPASQAQAEDSGDAAPARGGLLPDDTVVAGHDNKKSAAATPKRGEKRSPPPLQEGERPEKRAVGPDADTVAASATKPNKKKKSKKKKKKEHRKALAKPTSSSSPPPPQEDEHHGTDGREMAEQEQGNTSPPQDERRAREEEQQEKKTAEQVQEQHADADETSLAPPTSPRLTLGSDPEPTGFWGVEVKPGEPYAHEFSGYVHITQAEDSGDAAPARGGLLPDDSADAGHDNKKSAAATPKRGEKHSLPPLQEGERPEKRAVGPDADTVAASATKCNKKKSKKKKNKQFRESLAKPPPSSSLPPPQEDEHHGRKMAGQEPTNTSAPQDERRAREEEQQEKKTAEQEQEQHGQEQNADGTSLAPPTSPRLTLRSDPEPTGFWGVEVKPGEPYAHEFSGHVRITQATLGNLMSVGWTTITSSVGVGTPVSFCALNSTSATYRLDQEYGKGQNVVFSVTGDSSVHLAGYYKIPDAAAIVQALVTQIHKADDRETTHVHGTAQKHNAIDTAVHNDGTNQMVGQAGLNAAANLQALVTQSQEAADHKTTHAHDIARGHNALETEVHTVCTNQMVGQSVPNITISDEASLGSGNRLVDKEDVGGPIVDELKIDELEPGDCNAEMASYGKEVEVKYIGMLKNGKVVDSFKGGPAIHTFTIGVDSVIAGWHQGIQGMHVGGKRKLTIPPALGYKDVPQKRIPPNSCLVYDIELLRVSEPGEEKPKS